VLVMRRSVSAVKAEPAKLAKEQEQTEDPASTVDESAATFSKRAEWLHPGASLDIQFVAQRPSRGLRCISALIGSPRH
jgi:hypothetical protein